MLHCCHIDGDHEVQFFKKQLYVYIGFYHNSNLLLSENCKRQEKKVMFLKNIHYSYLILCLWHLSFQYLIFKNARILIELVFKLK